MHIVCTWLNLYQIFIFLYSTSRKRINSDLELGTRLGFDLRHGNFLIFLQVRSVIEATFLSTYPTPMSAAESLKVSGVEKYKAGLFADAARLFKEATKLEPNVPVSSIFIPYLGNPIHCLTRTLQVFLSNLSAAEVYHFIEAQQGGLLTGVV